MTAPFAPQGETVTVRRPRMPSASLLLRASIVWTALDVLLHVAFDELDPLRLGGNAVVVAAVLMTRVAPSRLLRACACWSAVVVVLCLNGLWFLLNGFAPAAAALVAVAVGLLGWAAVPCARRPPRLLLLLKDPLVAAFSRRRGRHRRGDPGGLRGPRPGRAVGRHLSTAVRQPAGRRRLLHRRAADPLGRSRLRRHHRLPELTEPEVRAAGGAWVADLDCAPEVEIAPEQRTSAALTEGIDKGVVVQEEGAVIEGGDGPPVVFGWPVVSDTIDPRQFRLTMASGAVVYRRAPGCCPTSSSTSGRRSCSSVSSATGRTSSPYGWTSSRPSRS